MAQNTPDVDARRFGRHLRSLRKVRGLTQEALAEHSGLSVDTIRRLEAGSFSPRLITLRRVSEGMELRLSTVFASFERGMLPAERELADLLVGRSESEIQMILEVARLLLRQWNTVKEG